MSKTLPLSYLFCYIALCFPAKMKLVNINLIIDFDSTLVKLEGLEELAEISLKNNPRRDDLINQICAITNLGMTGKISFQESLEERLMLFSPNKKHLNELVSLLRGNITESILRNSTFFKENAENIYIISGGFREWILPIIKDMGLVEENLLANEFIYSNDGSIVGFDRKNPLAQSGGKADVVGTLDLKGVTVMIGDGYTDYEVKKQGFADKFIIFEENISRTEIATLSDGRAVDWESVLECIKGYYGEYVFINSPLKTHCASVLKTT